MQKPVYVQEPIYEQEATPIPDTPESNFWTEENVHHVTQNLKIMSIAIDKSAKERYKWIHINFDQERDSAYMNLSKNMRNIHPEEFEESKEEIRWDIAW